MHRNWRLTYIASARCLRRQPHFMGWNPCSRKPLVLLVPGGTAWLGSQSRVMRNEAASLLNVRTAYSLF